MPEKVYDIVGLGVSTVDLLMLVDHLPAEEEILRARLGSQPRAEGQ